MSRQQSHAQTYGHPEAERSRVEMVHCGRCGAVKEFSFDALGRQRERCPKCDGVARRPGPFDVGAYMPQTALTNALPSVELEQLRAEVRRLEARPVLPEVEPGQLRCQRCAKGVAKPSHRFCHPCQGEGRSLGVRSRTPEERKRVGAAIRVARAGIVWPKKTCPCGITYVPTGPAQKYHSADCPARSGRRDA